MKLITELNKFNKVFIGKLQDHGFIICITPKDLVYEVNGTFKTITEDFLCKYQNHLNIFQEKDQRFSQGKIIDSIRIKTPIDYHFPI